MGNLEDFAEELEEIILNHLHNGLTFNVIDVEAEWNDLYPDIFFDPIIAKLVSQNKVDMINQTIYEYRDADEIDEFD